MDAMVTGRVPAEKKKLGNEILARLGTTPSRLIADIYDFLIEEERLPDLSRTAASEGEEQKKREAYLSFIQQTTLVAPNGFWDVDKSDKELIAEALEEKYGPVA